MGFRSSSSWWKEIYRLETKENCRSDWFSEGITRKVGSGYHISFWEDPWVGNVTLKTMFLGLFSNYLQQKGLMGKIRVIINGIMTWDLR